MANPIVTTIEPIEPEELTNVDVTIKGNTQNNGWETLEWGFWYYKESEGIGTKTYLASSTTPLGEGEFVKYIASLDPFTVYIYQARAYYRKWNEGLEPPAYEYVEIFGDWEEFTTHAYSTILNIFASDINKNTGEVTFWGSIDTPDDGHVIERGFQYGLTKNPTWTASESGSFSVGMFSLNRTVSLNKDFYVRAYVKTASGHYFYTGDGLDRGWSKFTTKKLTKDIAVLCNAGYYTDNEDFIKVFDKNGQENNSWKLTVGVFSSEVTVDKEGNAYYGYKYGSSHYVKKIKMSDGSVLNTYPISGYPRGICIGYGEFIYTLETDATAKNGVIYKRNLSNFSVIASITLNATYAYYCGIIADKIGNIYLGRTTNPDRIERYGIYTNHEIIDVYLLVIQNIIGVAKHDIADVVSGEAGICHFEVAGDHTPKFKEGESITIQGSTGNDGIYKIRTDSYYSLGNTYIPVEEAVPSGVSDGILTKTGDNSFIIPGEYNEQLTEGKQIEVEGSTGNNGTYTISAGGSYLREGNTVIPVDEDIPNTTIDGTATEVGDYSFTIEGEHAEEFTDLDDVTVSGSTGNNGDYAVKSGGAYLEEGDTIIPVVQTITDPTQDGNIILKGSLTMLGSINSPAPLTFGGIAISGGDEYGDFIYAGAYLDLPIKTVQYLFEINTWTPPGDWYNNSFSHVGQHKDRVIVQGTPYIGYSRALACYDSEENLIWKTDIVRGINAIAGYPFNWGATLINIKAVKLAGHLTLYGEITEIMASTIVERGFEYKIQDEEPGPEDEGTEVKEIGEFEPEEYNLSSWDTFDDLYRAEENKIWWFRAYCLDDEEHKFVAETWMKNVPTMTTFECTEVYSQEAKGNGELLDLGANIVTLRGFRVIKEYSGDLSGAWSYRSDGFEGELEIEKVYDNEGILIGFKWTGELHRDSLHKDVGGYGLGIYDKILGGGFLGEGFGLYLKSNDNLKVVAIAVNQLGMGFGEEVELNTGRLILPSDDEIVSDISAEKTITLGTIPGGATVTRIGIRLGRTMGCNEIHVFEDGEWGSGQSVTFFITDFVPGASYYKIPYIVINYGDFEEEVLAIPDYRNPERLEEWLEDYPIEIFPEVEDEDELDQTIIDSSVGDISYRTIIKEIKCEKIGEQSFIDRYGRRRSQTVDNHLIQSRANCIIIVDDYIDKFQILKQKYALEYDIPIPFEREDCVLLGDGKIKYKDDGQGLIAFKADGEGEELQEDFILAKIRKIDGRFISGKETILNIELEV